MPRKKRQNATKTLVNYIIDESGSMHGVAQSVRDGFNEYKQEVERNTDGEIFFTVTKFNTGETILHTFTPVRDVPDLDESSYLPGGMTALYDAVANTIRAVEADVDKDTKVITVVMTDGAENSSTENTQENVFNLIKEKENEGNWTFVFLGADQDAWAQAQNLGFMRANTMSYASAGTGHTHRGLASATVAALSSPQMSTPTFFADAGQSEADYQVHDNATSAQPKLWVPEKKKAPSGG